MNTWVYFDQRNLDNLPYTKMFPINDSLPLLYNSDGSDLPAEKFEGSRYLKYDHGMSKMIVDTVLDGEKNGDDPQTVIDFMMHALPDCIAKGAKEYFMIFSSHGGGYNGYGGDENVPVMTTIEAEKKSGTPEDNPDLTRRGRRKLAQANQNIVNAIQTALAEVEGAPGRLDVIGFDACLMSAIGAVDEYRDVANYVLASEAVEPGHGKRM